MRSYKVVILPSAKLDLIEARKWYSQFNKALPVRFKEEFRQAINILKLRPHVFAARYRSVRLTNLPGFPYAVHYFIDEAAFCVTIIAIHHTAIDPSKWKERRGIEE